MSDEIILQNEAEKKLWIDCYSRTGLLFTSDEAVLEFRKRIKDSEQCESPAPAHPCGQKEAACQEDVPCEDTETLFDLLRELAEPTGEELKGFLFKLAEKEIQEWREMLNSDTNRSAWIPFSHEDLDRIEQQLKQCKR